jgi:hypothetical protein
MRGLFNKIMNKINEIPNQAGKSTTNASQSQKNNQQQNINQNKQNSSTLTQSHNTQIKQNISPININANNILNQVKINDNSNILNENKPKTDNQIVIVNERKENKLQGFYYKKHIDGIKKLKISEPIIYQRQKMKVNFDIDILDYLFNDMTEIFKMKSNLVEENKNELIKKINETYDLVNILSDLNKNSDEILNKYMKQKKIMDNVEMMEIFIKTLSQEVDDLLSDIAKFEARIKKESEEQNNK